MNSEWTGSFPQKFGKTKALSKIHKNAEIAVDGLYRDIDSGIERIKGKRHFSVEQCKKQFEWKPCFRKTELEKMRKRPSGIKRLGVTTIEPNAKLERKHVTPVRKEIVQDLFNDSLPPPKPVNYTINNRIW